MTSDPIQRLRIVGLLEGISYLLLLFVAMPLKYLAGKPIAVRIAGSIHGLLFCLFVAALRAVTLSRGWPTRRWVEAMVASVLPFGTFVLDRRLRQEQAGS